MPPKAMKELGKPVLSQKEIATLTGAQVRAARALLGWTAAALASKTGIEVKTIGRAEAKGTDLVGVNAVYAKAIKVALENAGIVFIEANGGGPGVRLKDRNRRTVGHTTKKTPGDRNK